MLKRLSRFISTGFYSGLAPKAPGTVGTLFCALLMWILWNILPLDHTYYLILSPLLLSMISLLAGLIFIPLTYTDTKGTRSDEKSDKFDPQEVVIDEFAGFLTTLAFLPPNNTSLVLAFVSFRIFDISKPWPVKLFEKLPRAWGVMLDDIVAGLMAGGLIYFARYLSLI